MELASALSLFTNCQG